MSMAIFHCYVSSAEGICIYIYRVMVMVMVMAIVAIMAIVLVVIVMVMVIYIYTYHHMTYLQHLIPRGALGGTAGLSLLEVALHAGGAQ